jgi:hypothetical protein
MKQRVFRQPPRGAGQKNAGLDNKALPEEFIDCICGGIAAGLEKVINTNNK